MFEALEARQLLAFDPTPSEQYLLELTNRFRANPAAELAQLTTSLGTPARSSDADVDSALRYFNTSGPTLAQQWSSLSPAQPLAWNQNLYLAAQGHNQQMIAFDQQSHQLPGEPGLGARANNAGYSGWSNLGESVYAYARSVFHAHAGFLLDWGDTSTGIQDPPGHRESAINPTFRETGIRIDEVGTRAGKQTGPLVVSQEFGRRFNQGNPFLLGVVYQDITGNNFYNPGEGLGNVTVQISGAAGVFTTTSLSAGGWQVQVPPGTYSVTFSGSGFGAAVTYSSVVVSNVNAKLDARRGYTPPTPQIVVSGAGNTIADNDTTPAWTDLTHLGNANVGNQSVEQTFIISNPGTATLNLSGLFRRVTISGPNASEFALVRDAASSIAPGASTSFTIRFSPANIDLRTATVTIRSNAPTDSVYTFAIRGRGVLRPIAAVTGLGVNITPGDLAPDTADGTRFGTASSPGGSLERTFTIRNDGSRTLNIARVRFDGANPAQFTLRSLSDATIDPGQSAQIIVAFVPTRAGTQNANLVIESDDKVNPAYTFAVRGNGRAAPRLSITGNNLPIAGGSAPPTLANRTDFESVSASGGFRARQFTITNSGLAPLLFASLASVTISSPAYRVTIQPSAAPGGLLPGQSTVLRIRFEPGAPGVFDATVTIALADSTLGPFSFLITGSAA